MLHIQFSHHECCDIPNKIPIILSPGVPVSNTVAMRILSLVHTQLLLNRQSPCSNVDFHSGGTDSQPLCVPTYQHGIETREYPAYFSLRQQYRDCYMNSEECHDTHDVKTVCEACATFHPNLVSLPKAILVHGCHGNPDVCVHAYQVSPTSMQGRSLKSEKNC